MISVVIPNYNSGHLLKENLPKLLDFLKQSKFDYEVIVTDDASTDNSLEELKEFIPQLKIITNSVNTGFGSNVNRGIQVAKGEIIFILNAIDILPKDSSYFSLMLRHFNDPKVFSVAAVKKDTENHGRGVIIFNRGLFQHFRTVEKKEKIIYPMGDKAYYSAWGDGGAQAIRKEYYLKIGGFDPKYKFYWEDVDLGYRAWQAGYVVDYEPKAILIHKKEEGPIARRLNDREKRVLNLRNQFIFTWKNANLKQKLLFLIWLPYHLAVAIKNRDIDWFKAYV